MPWRLWIRWFPLVLFQLSLFNRSNDKTVADPAPPAQLLISLFPKPGMPLAWPQSFCILVKRSLKSTETHGPLFLCCTHTARLQSTLSSGLRQRNLTEVAFPRAGVNTSSIFLLLQEKPFIKRDLFSLICHSSWTRHFQFCLQSSRGTLETLKLSRMYDLSLGDTIFSISQSTLKYHEMEREHKPKNSNQI